MIRSDQEPAILSLVARAATVLKLKGVDLFTENSATYDSQGNGLAESAVRDIKGLVRTLLGALTQLYGRQLPSSSPIFVWLVRYAGQMLSRSNRGEDGKTGFELRRGRGFKRSMPPFGERVMWLRPGSNKGVATVAARCLDGIFLGPSDTSDELYVGTAAGAFKTRTVKRRDVTARADFALLESFKAFPWDEVASAKGSVPQRVVEATPLPREMAAQKPATMKRTYIRATDLQQHGYTSECPGCAAAAAGLAQRGHSESCRQRFEEIWSRFEPQFLASRNEPTRLRGLSSFGLAADIENKHKLEIAKIRTTPFPWYY